MWQPLSPSLNLTQAKQLDKSETTKTLLHIPEQFFLLLYSFHSKHLNECVCV